MNRWMHAVTRRWRELMLRRLSPHAIVELPVGHGLRMYLQPGDFMDRSFYLGTYDPKLIVLLDRWVRPGDTAIDIGAQKGYVAMHLAQAVGSEGHVLAFEPDTRARRWLEEHTARNGLTQLATLPFALGERTSVTRFHLSSQLGWSTAFPNTLAAPTLGETVEIRVEPLDELRRAGRIAWPDGHLRWIKIDCEGSEVLVLRGMHDTLRREAALLWIEVNADALRAAGTSADELFNLVQEAGYRTYVPRMSFTALGAPRLRLLHFEKPSDEPLYDVVAIKPAEWQVRSREIAPTVAIA